MAVADLNYFLSLGTVLLQVVTLAVFVVYILRKRESFSQIASSITKWGLWVAFLATAFGTLMAVYYSDVLGFEPCYWCYWQRIFLFPQVILLGMAAWKRDFQVASYSIVLSVIGAGVAMYHHILQMLPGSGLPCPAVGVSCAQRTIFEFGYVTFPLMAFTIFAFLIVVMLFVRSTRDLDA